MPSAPDKKASNAGENTAPSKNEMIDAANGVLGMFPRGWCTAFAGMVHSGFFLTSARWRRRSSKPSGISVDWGIGEVGVDMEGAEEKANRSLWDGEQ